MPPMLIRYYWCHEYCKRYLLTPARTCVLTIRAGLKFYCPQFKPLTVGCRCGKNDDVCIYKSFLAFILLNCVNSTFFEIMFFYSILGAHRRIDCRWLPFWFFLCLVARPPKNLLSGRRFTRFRTEREGFEPSIELPLYSISSAAPSTTRPPLQGLVWHVRM